MKLFGLPSQVRMRTRFSGVLRTDILAYFLRVNSCALGVDVNLIVLGDCVDEVAEVGPHLYHN